MTNPAKCVPLTTMQYSIADDVDPDVNLCCPGVGSCLLSTIMPCVWLGACKIIEPNLAAVALIWGKYEGTVNKEGCYCVNPCGTDLRMVSKKVQTSNMTSLKVIDKNGSPVVMDGVVSWRVSSARRAIIDVQDHATFVFLQAGGATKAVAALFPFESHDEPSMRTTPDAVADAIRKDLQARVNIAGVEVVSFAITDLSYSAEVAQMMLVRQQADATLKARQIIVEGAVTIATRAIEHLGQSGITMTDANAQDMVKNLVTVLCADRPVMPTINLGGR